MPSKLLSLNPRTWPESARRANIYWQDVLLISIMAILAGCGLIYEYLLAHYAGRVLGMVEPTLFAMIGLMIVAMGIGSFLARGITCAFTGFAWLEIFIALLGATSVLLIAGIFALTQLFPQVIANTYQLPGDALPTGGLFALTQQIAKLSPYGIGFLLGLLIGMEIPLIARIRQSLHTHTLTHNAGTIYGADYIGAGIGAALWVMFMLTMDLTQAAALTAAANTAAGMLFYWRFHDKIRYSKLLLILQLGCIWLILLIAHYGNHWEIHLENLLYRDQVIYSTHTPYQHITVTQRQVSAQQVPIYSLYINGRVQFTSQDEHIYHSLLVHPAMAASARHNNILLIGGGDGLALRDILNWQPQQVTVLELDAAMVKFFQTPLREHNTIINQALLTLNQYAFSDPRVNLILGDAFNQIDELIQQHQKYDTIIVDLPDPSHPDLNKLYSLRFYHKLKQLLMGDGAISIQSTSPYHAKKAFLSIGKTVKHAGFSQVEQYHENVPSFGEWGWTIATLNGLSPRQRLQQLGTLPTHVKWLTMPLLLAAFEFPKQFFTHLAQININRVESHTVYQYHQNAWLKQQGIYQTN